MLEECTFLFSFFSLFDMPAYTGLRIPWVWFLFFFLQFSFSSNSTFGNIVLENRSRPGFKLCE